LNQIKRLWWVLAAIVATFALADTASLPAQGPAGVTTATYRARRDAAMAKAPNSLWLVRSLPRTSGIASGFRQDPLFYYLTGLENAVGAVLVLDSARRETWLFVPERGQLRGFVNLMSPPYGYVEVGAESAQRIGTDGVRSWNEFADFVDRRLAEDPSTVVRGPFRDKPQALASLVGQSETAAWESTLRSKWPAAQFGPAPDARTVREIKDVDEIAVLRRVADMSAAALRTGLTSLRPGRRQRESEVDVVAACIKAGADGPSFWPWVMSGPNSKFANAIQSFADYRALDRPMRTGELVRVDIGCASEHYEGDVGRTAPVSGRFDDGQREAWDLFIDAYRAGLAAVRPGVTSKQIFAIWQDVFRKRQTRLRQPFAQRTAAAALSAAAEEFWQIHGVGLEAAEALVTTLQAGQVVAFEPILTVDEIGLYLEDMVLVTATGSEVLTKDLPYTAAEIEIAMRRK